MNTDQLAAIEQLASKIKADHPGLRYGQALINALWDVDRERYKAISATAADCFYDDSKIPSFWEALK